LAIFPTFSTPKVQGKNPQEPSWVRGRTKKNDQLQKQLVIDIGGAAGIEPATLTQPCGSD
jgi:hypothetical protein